eukprot:scaffold5981_cov66-Phaeocystis_antarctica.AAC.2
MQAGAHTYGCRQRALEERRAMIRMRHESRRREQEGEQAGHQAGEDALTLTAAAAAAPNPIP